MQLFKFVFTSAVIIGLLAVIVHEFSPEIMTFLSIPALWTVTTNVQNIIKGIFPTATTVQSKTESDGRPKEKSRRPIRPKERLFTPEQLKNYDGNPGSKGLYLALLGLVYNVKKGKKHYGPGGGYEFFSGRDASRAFVSGDFTEKGLIDDISELTHADYIGLDEWVKFYEKDYKYVGKVIGRYYDHKGDPTSYTHETQRWIAEAYQGREDENQEKKIFPPCNSEWTPESGSRVWCTAHSGGVDREWVGVPRKLFSPGHSTPRCCCVKNSGPPSHDLSRKTHDDVGDLDNPNLEEYKGCHPEEHFCYLTDK